MSNYKIAFWLGALAAAILFSSIHTLGSGKAVVSVPVVADNVPKQCGSFVCLGETGSSVNDKFALQAIGHLNKIYENGCLKEQVLKYKFKSTSNYKGRNKYTNEEIWQEFTKNVPHALNLRWYSKRFSSVIGYTYNESDIIWSNTRMMGVAKDYAAHLAHELSHQSRAGGFVHWTVFSGSVPYAIGDLAAYCLSR